MSEYKNDFPIFQNSPNLVYLDSAATSQKPQIVLDAEMDFYKNYNANIHRGIYPIAEKATAKVEEVRKKVAKFINANSSNEIIFTKGTTESINLVMYSWGKENINKDDVVMTTIAEHHANFVPWQMLVAENNAVLKIVDIDESQQLKTEEMIELATSAKFLAFSWVSNMLGNMLDVKNIISRIRKKNKDIKIMIDAAQAVPHKIIDVQEMDCDFLVFSGHKMLAGTGIGVLYAKKNILSRMKPFLYGGSMIKEVAIEKTTYADIPNKFEGGTLNIAGIISLGAAIDYLNTVGLEKIHEHEKSLITYCLEKMGKIEGMIIYGPKKVEDRSSLITFNIDGLHPHDIAQVLGDNGVCVRAGHHCTMPLHKSLRISASARASVYLYNTEEDIDKFILALKKVKKIFK